MIEGGDDDFLGPAGVPPTDPVKVSSPGEPGGGRRGPGVLGTPSIPAVSTGGWTPTRVVSLGAIGTSVEAREPGTGFLRTLKILHPGEVRTRIAGDAADDPQIAEFFLSWQPLPRDASGNSILVLRARPPRAGLRLQGPEDLKELGAVARLLARLHRRGVSANLLVPDAVVWDAAGAVPTLAEVGLDLAVSVREVLAGRHPQLSLRPEHAAWWAPEQIERLDARRPLGFSPASDVYFLGLATTTCLRGQFPWPCRTMAEALEGPRTVAAAVAALPVSPSARALLARAVDLDPNQRPLVGELVAALGGDRLRPRERAASIEPIGSSDRRGGAEADVAPERATKGWPTTGATSHIRRPGFVRACAWAVACGALVLVGIVTWPGSTGEPVASFAPSAGAGTAATVGPWVYLQQRGARLREVRVQLEAEMGAEFGEPAALRKDVLARYEAAWLLWARDARTWQAGDASPKAADELLRKARDLQTELASLGLLDGSRAERTKAFIERVRELNEAVGPFDREVISLREAAKADGTPLSPIPEPIGPLGSAADDASLAETVRAVSARLMCVAGFIEATLSRSLDLSRADAAARARDAVRDLQDAMRVDARLLEARWLLAKQAERSDPPDAGALLTHLEAIGEQAVDTVARIRSSGLPHADEWADEVEKIARAASR